MTATKDLSASAVRQIFVLTRLMIIGVAAFVVHRSEQNWLQAVSHWDVQHFISIARQGYADHQEIAFFPGLPALLRASTAFGLPIEIGGIVIGLTCSAVAAWALYRMFGGTVAALWLIGPTAVFTVVGYTESPFCAAAFWAWERARAGRWWQAAALAALACTFRVSGLFLIGALAVMAMTENLGPKKDRLAVIFSRWVWLLIPVAVLGLYAIYLHHITGSWSAWFQTQADNWQRGFISPVDSFKHTLDAAKTTAWPDRPLVATVFQFEILSMFIGLVTTIWMLLRRRWAEASWVGIQCVAFGITYWYMSINRAVILWFPFFMMLATLVTWRPGGGDTPKALEGSRDVATLIWRGLMVVLVVAMVGVMLWWSWLFFSGNWAS